MILKTEFLFIYCSTENILILNSFLSLYTCTFVDVLTFPSKPYTFCHDTYKCIFKKITETSIKFNGVWYKINFFLRYIFKSNDGCTACALLAIFTMTSFSNGHCLGDDDAAAANIAAPINTGSSSVDVHTNNDTTLA